MTTEGRGQDSIFSCNDWKEIRKKVPRRAPNASANTHFEPVIQQFAAAWTLSDAIADGTVGVTNFKQKMSVLRIFRESCPFSSAISSHTFFAIS